jgi:hypothetical protein
VQQEGPLTDPNVKQPNRLIKCYTIKQNESNEDKSAEDVLKKDILDEKGTEQISKVGDKETEDQLIAFNNELDDDSIELIKDALNSHYLLKDLHIGIMYSYINIVIV